MLKQMLSSQTQLARMLLMSLNKNMSASVDAKIDSLDTTGYKARDCFSMDWDVKRVRSANSTLVNH